MASVKGIGGAFIYSRDAARIAAWYRDVLGIRTELLPDGTGYYKVFETRDVDTLVLRENPVFAINQAPASLPDDRRAFMVNLRVDDLRKFLDQLRNKGVRIEDRLLEWKGGKHAWITDPDGNRVELYEEILADDAV